MNQWSYEAGLGTLAKMAEPLELNTISLRDGCWLKWTRKLASSCAKPRVVKRQVPKCHRQTQSHIRPHDEGRARSLGVTLLKLYALHRIKTFDTGARRRNMREQRVSGHSIMYTKVGPHALWTTRRSSYPRPLQASSGFSYLDGAPNASLINDFFSIPSKTSCMLDYPRLP